MGPAARLRRAREHRTMPACASSARPALTHLEDSAVAAEGSGLGVGGAVDMQDLPGAGVGLAAHPHLERHVKHKGAAGRAGGTACGSGQRSATSPSCNQRTAAARYSRRTAQPSTRSTAPLHPPAPPPHARDGKVKLVHQAAPELAGRVH